jgi:hypothetical protein
MFSHQFSCNGAVLRALGTLVILTGSVALADHTGQGMCNGPIGCDGSNNGPDGVPWNQKACQTQGTGAAAIGVYRIYFPTVVCNFNPAIEYTCTNRTNYYVCYREEDWEEPGCQNTPGNECNSDTLVYKDGACSGTVPD